MKTTKSIQIPDDHAIKSVTRNGRPVPFYDDGFGELYAHRNSLGISGVVRAKSWEDAYSICQDEFFPEANETIEELIKEYGFKRETVKIVREIATGKTRDATTADYSGQGGRLADSLEFVKWETRETPDPEAWSENELFCESYGFRPNGPRAGKWEDGTPRDPIGHGIYAKDLNGDALDLLTPELAQRLEIEVTTAACVD